MAVLISKPRLIIVSCVIAGAALLAVARFEAGRSSLRIRPSSVRLRAGETFYLSLTYRNRWPLSETDPRHPLIVQSPTGEDVFWSTDEVLTRGGGGGDPDRSHRLGTTLQELRGVMYDSDYQKLVQYAAARGAGEAASLNVREGCTEDVVLGIAGGPPPKRSHASIDLIVLPETRPGRYEVEVPAGFFCVASFPKTERFVITVS